MKTLFLILLLAVGTYSQSIFDNYELTYEKVAINSDTLYLVKKDFKVKKQLITFEFLTAQIKEFNSESPKLNPNNYIKYMVTTNCKTLDYEIPTLTGVLGGHPFKEKSDIKDKAQPGEAIRHAVNFVCKLDEAL